MTQHPDNLINNLLECTKCYNFTNDENVICVQGKFSYYHYCCDEIDDRGWGCGYRTLQTICSWAHYNKSGKKETPQHSLLPVPSIIEIQNALVAMCDKPKSFLNSNQWIGSFEVCLCMDYFYDISCKMIHVKSGNKIFDKMDEIYNHFKIYNSPIMMGGNKDASSKGIFGAKLGLTPDACSVLVIDPHLCERNKSKKYLFDEKWVEWKSLSTFDSSSFYNLCLPLYTNIVK